MGLLHPGLMQTMMLTRLMHPCGNGGAIREQPPSLHRSICQHGNICHDRRCLAVVVAVLFFAVVQAHPLAQPMACLQPGLIQPVDPGLIQPVVVHEPVAVLWFPSSKHSPGSRWTFWEVDLLEPGGRCEPVAFLQAGLIQPGLIQPGDSLQAGSCWKRQKCYS